MADDSVLRSSLKEVKDMQEKDSGESAPNPTTSSGSSLLDELLQETNQQAKREMEQVKAQLRDREAASEEAQRQADVERRKRLDDLRDQEAKRRDSMIAARNKRLEDEKAAARPAVAAQVSKAVASNWKLLAAAFVVVALGTGGWYVADQQSTQAEKAAGDQARNDARSYAKSVDAMPKYKAIKLLSTVKRSVRSAETDPAQYARRAVEVHDSAPDVKSVDRKRRAKRRGKKRRKGAVRIRKLKLDQL
jgi:hypothetical protein